MYDKTNQTVQNNASIKIFPLKEYFIYSMLWVCFAIFLLLLRWMEQSDVYVHHIHLHFLRCKPKRCKRFAVNNSTGNSFDHIPKVSHTRSIAVGTKHKNIGLHTTARKLCRQYTITILYVAISRVCAHSVHYHNSIPKRSAFESNNFRSVHVKNA